MPFPSPFHRIAAQRAFSWRQCQQYHHLYARGLARRLPCRSTSSSALPTNVAHAAVSRCSQTPYPTLSAPRTSAPSNDIAPLTSAEAVSAWPVCDARCRAVELHSHREFLEAPSERRDHPTQYVTATRRCSRRPYPSLLLLCTSAPALTSAIAVSFSTFKTARRSAGKLRSKSDVPAAPSEWTDRSPNAGIHKQHEDASRDRTHCWTGCARPRRP